MSTGPIMQIVMFDLGHQREGRLLIVIHHLAVDGVSWRILLSDLETIYQQLTTQQPIQLSPKTTAFIDWAEKLYHHAQSELLKSELDYWLNQPWEQATPIPIDLNSQTADNTIGSTNSVTVTLSATATHKLLGSVHEAYNTQINDLLLTGLAMTLAQWTGNAAVPIDLEGHGREELFEDVDLSRTVGWFTSLFPVLLQLPSSNSPATAIKAIKEQLRTIPQRGIGYGILRYLCADEEVKQQLQRIPSPEIGFNYLGQFDQVESATGWKFTPEATGQQRSPLQNWEHRLDLNCLVIRGELQIDWTYSSQVHQRETISDLAQSYLQNLTVLIEHCQSEDAGGHTPSDFPKAQLEQSELDELVAPISAKNIEAIYPLSPMQQGMLFHSLYAPQSGVYVEQMTLTLIGDVNVEAFKSAWQTVIDRYSILRTLFIWENRPIPLQIVLKQVELRWTNLDWLLLSPATQQQQLSELLHAQRGQGFQFDRAPLMGCTLIQLTHDTYQFVWSFHHILLDGWCLPIIFKEVLSFYDAEVSSKTCYLPSPTPYQDYITWLTAQDRAASTDFWRQMLQGFSAPTSLVVALTPHQSLQPDSNYRELEFRLSADVSGKLQALAQQWHVTLSTVIQAAWGLLLSRYSGEQDILFGVTVSGRPASLSGVENMVGLFINTLPLRLQISPEQQLISWLKQIQQLMLELQQYSYTPLVEIQSLSEIVGGIPLFESIVVFENYPMDRSLAHNTGSLQVGEIVGYEQTNFPLTVIAVPGHELLVKINYDLVRFAEDTIERMLGHLQTIFSAIATNPHQTLGELPLLSEAERHQLLVDWNDTEREYPKDRCIHQLFEEQVAKTPDAIAVVFEEQELTYQQLNERANQLAHYLQTLGVKPEVLVGICVERSLEMVVGLLGILKAGGAYVPLDPSYPAERLSYMLSDAGVQVLLTQENLLSVLPADAARMVCLDRNWEAIQQHCQENLMTDVGTDNLAYVIYTSGSTGQPKGVCVAHRGVNRLIVNTNYINLQEQDVVGLASNFSFDAVTFEIWGALVHGAKLVGIERDVMLSPHQLANSIQSQKISTLFLTTALFNQIANAVPSAFNSLQNLMFGGEAVDVSAVKAVLKHQPPQRLLHVYGPTESTTFSTWYLVSDVLEEAKTIPIGRPIANTQVYVLDRQMQPVAIGVTGELHIGGDGLARGYLNRPELTQAKFVPNPFSSDKSARLYKTGDLARYLADGNIEFLGRLDHQVKIRGFRVELEEIEAVISQHPQVSQVVVIDLEDISANKYLVAYVITQSGAEISSAEIKDFVKEKIPSYMVPGAVICLDSLPLTPNGKVDRQALPKPDMSSMSSIDFVPPRTHTEEVLVEIWRKILKVEKISIHDNFFALGGHSLLATQVNSQISEVFQVKLPLKNLFESSTVASLAVKIDNISSTLQAFQNHSTTSTTNDLEEGTL
ncbi:amino acid adenylation domain-containing protein [Chamaesiphon sp.]|uniref:amino acid adenylation domain-containing protein n=1 Tax=Chamaesiphon sp. TaxID=2814140 RepID=UPI003593E50D